MLQQIKIEGYKSIKSLDLRLNKINILIGSNGSGKSNFISFFDLLNHIYEKQLGYYSLSKGIENLLYYGSKYTDKITGFLKFENNGYEFILQPNLSQQKFFLTKENSIFYRDGTPEPSYQLNRLESFIKENDYEFGRNRYLKYHLENYKVYHFHDTSETSSLRKSSPINNNRFLKSDGANLPSFLYWIKVKYPKTFNRIEKTIQFMSPFFYEFKLEPSKQQKDSIDLEWNNKNFPDHFFNAHQLSDGTLRFIALATLFLQPEDDYQNRNPKTIIIDEPELGLHPSAIYSLAELIKSAADRNYQIIISTQSVELLNYFTPEDIITVDYQDNQSIFKRLENSKDLQKWLEDYSLGELWSKSVIEGQT